MFGDEGNTFDLLAGLSPVGGDDVLGGGPGQDNHLGEGGDDIMLMSEGSNKFFGDYGFDWVTLRGWNLPEFVELSLLALPNAPLNFNDLRNKYRFVDGASGWDLDDHIAGSNEVLCEPPDEIAECFVVGMELTRTNARKIVGLETLMGPTGFNANLDAPAIPGVKDVGFMGGDILLGGRGSDILEGKKGDDLIDGDLWLNVQLRAVMNDTSVKLVDSPLDLVDDVFANPQRLNPGNITIVKTIVTPQVPAPDCGAAAPRNCDTAVFSFPITDYQITQNANGTLTVQHVPAVPADVPASDGTDTLRNIERLQFGDGTIIPAPGAGGGGTTTIVPAVVGLAQAAASTAIVNADLTTAVLSTNSPTVAIGNVISQNPAAGQLRPFGSTVTITVSLGALVPNVVGLSQAAANTALANAGVVAGSITSVNNAAAAGTVISQSPAGGTSVNPGSGIALTVSLGPALRAVPNVVNQTQAAATTSITNAGLTLGAVTSGFHPTIPNGSVISSSPVAGTLVAPGSAVAIVVSQGPAPITGLVLALGFDEAAGTTALDSSASHLNGTIRQALRVPGKFGSALQFDGVNDWVSVANNAALQVTSAVTIEAWVNPVNMSGWETVLMKERGVTGEGLLSYALYAHDGAPLASGTPRPAGYLRLNPAASTVDRAVRGSAQLPVNTWTHLAMTYERVGNNLVQTLYVNGAVAGTTTTVASATAANNNIAENTTANNGMLRIGGNNSSLQEFFQGMIDEVRVYNRALTLAEIQSDMNTPVVR
jgi:beta-lactam-binding protein with PASTA domain